MAEAEVVTIKPNGRKRAAIIGAVVVVLVGLGVGYKLTSGGKKSAAAATVNTASGATRRNGAPRNGVAGTLASVNGGTLLVTDQNGTKTTVHTSSSTVFTTTATGALSDVKVGDRVVAMGANAGTNHITAERISDLGIMTNEFGGNGQPPPGGQGFRNRTGNGNGNGNDNGAGNGTPTRGPAPGTTATGTVSSINGTTFLVKDTNGTETTIDTTNATTFSVLKQINVSELVTGEMVRVTGPKAADGTITATSVREGSGGFGFGGFRGGNGGSGGSGPNGNTGTTTGTGA